MKEKKESSITNIFVYFLIIVFIVLIIAPPLTRVFLQKKTPVKNPTTNNTVKSATALTCQKEVPVGTMLYNVSITSNYGNDTLNKVTFIYEYPTVIDQTIVDNPVLTEINNLRVTGLLEETTTSSSTTFVLTKENKEKNPLNTSLDTFFNPLETQKTNLESLGYTCTSLTA